MIIRLSLNEDLVSRDGLKNHLGNDASTVATGATTTTTKAGPFKGYDRPRSRLGLGSVKDTLNGEESREEIH